jgi:hypothetical protein
MARIKIIGLENIGGEILNTVSILASPDFLCKIITAFIS